MRSTITPLECNVQEHLVLERRVMFMQGITNMILMVCSVGCFHVPRKMRSVKRRGKANLGLGTGSACGPPDASCRAAAARASSSVRRW